MELLLFLGGVILGIVFMALLNRSSGTFNISIGDTGKKIYNLDLDIEPTKLDKKKRITFKVRK